MNRSTLERLQDILSAAALAAQHAGDLDAARLAATPGLRDAALFQIVVLGEAASQLPAELQALAPEIPWLNIRNMRNLVVHAYWQIDYGIVADTTKNDLEPLTAATRRLIEFVDRDANGD
jgi:uncharacterized protein with HEPN domain